MTALKNEHVNLEINNLIDENKTKLFKYDNEKKAIELEDLKKGKILNEDLNISNVPEEKERERWDSFMEYFLSIIGFVIDLGKYFYFN
jgi:hypothetical protein